MVRHSKHIPEAAHIKGLVAAKLGACHLKCFGVVVEVRPYLVQNKVVCYSRLEANDRVWAELDLIPNLPN